MATIPHFAALIVGLLDEQTSITFADLMDLPHARGTVALLASPNVALWTNMSDELADAIHTLRARGVVHFTPCDPMIYVAAGKVLDFPLALSDQGILNGTYVHPHWAPVAIERGPAWGTDAMQG